MNKLVRLLSIFTLSASMAFYSCKGDVGPAGPQGAKGDQGTPGTNGKDGVNGVNGNANITSFEKTVAVADWALVDVPGIGTASTTKWGSAALASATILGDSYVQVFLKSGVTKKALPLTYTTDTSVERVDYSYKTGQAEILYRFQPNGGSATFAPAGPITFEVVVIQKTLATAMLKDGVNLKSYSEVVNYANKTAKVQL